LEITNSCIIFSFNDEIFLARRSPIMTSWSNHWAAIGGTIEEGETVRECLMREIEEEIGCVPHFRFSDMYVSDGAVIYLGKVKDKFFVKLNFEHDAWGWFRCDNLPEPIIPTVEYALSFWNIL